MSFTTKNASGATIYHTASGSGTDVDPHSRTLGTSIATTTIKIPLADGTIAHFAATGSGTSGSPYKQVVADNG
jgi:hypothetical protein